MITFTTITDCDLRDFPAWCGGKDTLDTLIKKGDCNKVEGYINCCFDDHTPEDVEINDLLWFERDEIAITLGYDSWDEYEYGEDNEDEDEMYFPIVL